MALQPNHAKLERTSVLSNELSINCRERKRRSYMGLISYEVLFISRINKFHREVEFYIEAQSMEDAVKQANKKLSQTYGDCSSFSMNYIKEI
jgi:hypothetical protein